MVEVTLKTKRGTVVVVFDDQENVSDAFATQWRKWGAKTWARQRPSLIRRARLLCAKVGTIRTAAPHSEALNGKAVVASHKIEGGKIAAGVYYSIENDYFILCPNPTLPVTPNPFAWAPRTKRLRKINWDIKTVYTP
jgi:hypothetical protein